MKERIAIQMTADVRLVADYRFIADRRSRAAYQTTDWEEYNVLAEADAVPKPIVGQVYMVAEQSHAMCKYPPRLLFIPDNGTGLAGNSNAFIHRYHGWRGTTNDWSVYAHGVRRCLSVRQTGKRSQRVVIVFGRDLKADEA